MNGLVVIDKDKGYTSRDVVNIVSGVLGTKKVGHTGTLDPLATGVMVVGVGKGLKVSELINRYMDSVGYRVGYNENDRYLVKKIKSTSDGKDGYYYEVTVWIDWYIPFVSGRNANRATEYRNVRNFTSINGKTYLIEKW